MEELKNKINNLDNLIKELIEKRMKEFSSFEYKNEEEWFSELCFCILTANSRAKTALAIQNELRGKGFISRSQEEIKNVIIKHHHRFHNNKAKYIVEARPHFNIKNKVNNMIKEKGFIETRNWIAENVKGLGYKEASHFLRNTGHENIAILDRHILNLMKENKLINEIPKPITKKKYIEIEKQFMNLANKWNMSPAKLDLAMWYLKAGEVLK